MSVQSYVRICPIGALANAVDVNPSIQEVTLQPGKQSREAKSWIVDNIIESQDGNLYPSQDDIWRNFLQWFETCSDAAQLSCISLGCCRSGKTYTFFGENTFSGRGIIPRMIEHAFVEQGATSIELTMCLSRGESVLDMLDPPASYPAAGNCIHSEAIGPCIIPLKSTVIGGVSSGLKMLRFGFIAASMIMFNTTDATPCTDIIVTLRITTPHKRYTMNFIDSSSLILEPPTAYTDADRLTAINLAYAGVTALSECGIGVGANCNIAAKLHTAEARKHPPWERSLLTYLVQDTLLQAKHTLVIGSLRSNTEYFHENAATLSFLESVHDACEMIRLADREANQAAETHILTCYTDIDLLLSVELSHLSEQIKAVNASTPNSDDYRSFLTAKRTHLHQIHSRMSNIPTAIRDSADDAIPLIRWLKHRGIASSYLDKGEFAAAWETSQMPTRTQPVLIPLYPNHFYDLHVHFPITIGHTAFCGKEIYSGKDIIGAKFDKIFQDISTNIRVIPVGTIGVKEAHCVIFRMGSDIKLRACGDARVVVNGAAIAEEKTIKDEDVVEIGVGCMMLLRVPTALHNSDEDDEIISEPQAEEVVCLNEKYLLRALHPQFLRLIAHTITERNIRAHYVVQRDMISITRQTDRSEDMKLEQFEPDDFEVVGLYENMSHKDRISLAHIVFAVSVANFFATELSTNVVYQAQLSIVPGNNKKSKGHVSVGKYVFSLEVAARGTNADGKIGTGGWTWSFALFKHRVVLMNRCYVQYLLEYGADIDRYEESLTTAASVATASTAVTSAPTADPFIDSTDFELVGVAYVHLDSLNYLLDINDTPSIITFKGTEGGAVKLSMRCWIDKVEPVPPYISIDKESVLNDFMNRKCILRLHIDSLQGINSALSSEIYCAFKFFCHSSEYRTARIRSALTTTPFLNTAVVLEQLITPEFISYIQRRSLELEVYGCRASVVAATSTSRHYVGEMKLADETDVQSVGNASLDDASSISPSDEIEALKKELQHLSEMLNQTERSNRRATRVVDTLKTDTPAKKGLMDEKRRLEAKLHAEIAKSMELEAKVVELQEIINRSANEAEGNSKKISQKSRVCVVS